MKETYGQKYLRLMKELAEMNQDLNERQREISVENPPTADLEASKALVEHKRKKILEIEKQFRGEK